MSVTSSPRSVQRSETSQLEMTTKKEIKHVNHGAKITDYDIFAFETLMRDMIKE